MDSTSDIKIILKKISDGYSRIEFGGKTLYYKHATLDDEAELEEIYNSYFKKAKKIGAMTQKEKLAFLDEEGLWTKKEEEELKRDEKYLKSLRDTRPKLLLDQQKEQLDKTISEKEKELLVQKSKRISLIGETCETYAENKKDTESIKVLCFKDKELKERFFSDEEFDHLSNEDLASLFILISTENMGISSENIKRLVADNYFFNLYCLMDAASAWNFFDKPIIRLSHNQSLVLFYARVLRSIRENNDIPEGIDNDYDKIIEYVQESKKKKEMAEKAKEKGAFSVVGAKKGEMEKMGINSAGAVTPFDIMRRTGKKKLTKEDFI